MKFLHIRKDSYRAWLSFFLILGAISGTVFCNMMNGQMRAELGSFEGSLISAPALRKMDFSQLFFQVLAGRIPPFLILCLMEMTSSAPILLMGAASWLGFSSAVMVSVLTMQAGFFGILRYLVFICPQCLFYIPVLYILFLWLPENAKTLRPALLALLLFLICTGAAAEAFLNPWLVATFL